jgi:hypothetical protein
MKKITVRITTAKTDEPVVENQFAEIVKEMRQMPAVKNKEAVLKKRKNCIHLEYKGANYYIVRHIHELKKLREESSETPGDLDFMDSYGFKYYGLTEGNHVFSYSKFVPSKGITFSCSVRVAKDGTWSGGGSDAKFPKNRGSNLSQLKTYANSVKKKMNSLGS